MKDIVWNLSKKCRRRDIDSIISFHAAKVGELRQKDTRSNDDKYYNFKYRTERFRKSPLVYAINSYNNSF